MDTYHDILGTTKDNTAQECKLRYKALGARVHPDKGGSKALMQLVRRAYDKVSSGAGHHEVFDPEVTETDNTLIISRMQSAISTLKDENERLTKENEALKQSTSESPTNASPSTSDSEKDQKIERLSSALDSANKELMQVKISLADANKALQQEKANNKTNQTANQQPFSPAASGSGWDQTTPAKSGNSGSLKLKLTALIICLLLVLGMGYLSLGIGEWDRWIDEKWQQTKVWVGMAEEEVVAEKAVEVTKEPTVTTLAVEPESPIVDPVKPQHQIMLNHEVDKWQLRYFQNTFVPYLATKSEQGSLVLADCDGVFKYYLAQDLRPLRMPANLTYQSQEQGFFVYEIPYGKGSSAEHWQKSKHLTIFEDVFSNKGFEQANSEFGKLCAVSQ
ncbi:hypothetical protein MHO82_05320 [Vibrio sp. Of7-15]|uniref:J domain-containing protein n=1 Tax=Vibrio sp. Of7-15 TaxID=2724879 RepID=UPI001EF21CB6|nr:J domain-containing protein [Vibrio sp. Of7-15]MCG7496272.1 hypothetical protein [Vibrio sp. Of7-15]